ncbi:unnamed protein product [Owenia fusiformis]|uniref:Uncharacterized protein n=1 Tax=Owenia fusiformis TaxID=6347 RepID=A0A8J1U0B1_OWEFU|nr:unnamed protein product [Owenia fusiformis]
MTLSIHSKPRRRCRRLTRTTRNDTRSRRLDRCTSPLNGITNGQASQSTPSGRNIYRRQFVKQNRIKRESTSSDDSCCTKEEFYAGRARCRNPMERERMRPWLIRIVDSGNMPGVKWVDSAKTKIRISWIHAARHGYEPPKENIFKAWAIHSGKYDPQDQDPKKWKANFRCAINTLPDVKLSLTESQKRGKDAFKVYELKPEKARKRKTKTPALSTSLPADLSNAQHGDEAPRYHQARTQPYNNQRRASSKTVTLEDKKRMLQEAKKRTSDPISIPNAKNNIKQEEVLYSNEIGDYWKDMFSSTMSSTFKGIHSGCQMTIRDIALEQYMMSPFNEDMDGQSDTSSVMLHSPSSSSRRPSISGESDNSDRGNNEDDLIVELVDRMRRDSETGSPTRSLTSPPLQSAHLQFSEYSRGSDDSPPIIQEGPNNYPMPNLYQNGPLDPFPQHHSAPNFSSQKMTNMFDAFPDFSNTPEIPVTVDLLNPVETTHVTMEDHTYTNLAPVTTQTMAGLQPMAQHYTNSIQVQEGPRVMAETIPSPRDHFLAAMQVDDNTTWSYQDNQQDSIAKHT